MKQHSGPVQRLIAALGKLPGVGPRSAERIAFHLLKGSSEAALELADAIRDVKTNVLPCSVCFNLSDVDPCPVCADPSRDLSQICVVEQPKELISLEQSGGYRGVYHVLLGRVAIAEGVLPGDITLEPLLRRVQQTDVREVILATNPNLDGDATALLIASRLRERFPRLKITRLARGLAAGTPIENANRNMLADALEGRREIEIVD